MDDYNAVADVFYSVIRQKYSLIIEQNGMPDDSLVRQWFYMAIGDYELNVKPLNYDREADVFGEVLHQSVITNLGLFMELYYVKRERSRINKLNNLISRDVSMNAHEGSKREMRLEYEEIKADIEQRLHRQKQHSYV